MSRVKDLWQQPSRRGRGKRWLAVWEGPDGREASRAFERKTDAARYGSAMETDVNRGAYLDPKRGAVTLREYGEAKYLPSLVHLRPNSAETYGSHLRNHIYPALGGRRMGTVERTDVKSFVALLARQLAPSTTETVFAVLRGLMQSAVDDRVIAANPCSRVPLPKVESRVVEPLPASAVLALADVITPRYRLLVVLGAGAGLREGEAFGLTVPRVDFLRRRLRILDQAQRGTSAPLKTAASTRVIPAGDWVLSELSAHLAVHEPGPGGVIVTNAAGRTVQRSSFWEHWNRARAAAGLPGGTRFHDLRHFYASALIAANLNPKVIQARLGHATIAETMDTYGHLFPDAEDLGRGAVDDALAAAAEQQRNTGTR